MEIKKKKKNKIRKKVSYVLICKQKLKYVIIFKTSKDINMKLSS